jgi:serine/threonine-protein kinase
MVSGKISGKLLGRYSLAEVVGTGAMGIVFRAHDEVLDRTVAIKLLKDEFASDPATVERFRREALIAASLQHPGIAQVFDFGNENGRSFIVMEFLDGQDLRSMLASGKQLSVAAAAEIVARAAEALDHAHHAGTVHRDVKPGNIFITHSQQLKVTDFGIARAADRAPVTRSGTVVGTFQYLSPEQALGVPVSPVSDIYSLGCVLFELLTGRPPFDGDSLAALSMAHVTSPLPRAASINPSVPPELDAVVSKCLAKEPEHRFGSGVEMAAALRRAASLGTGEALAQELGSLTSPKPQIGTGAAETAVSASTLDATRVLGAETSTTPRRRRRSRSLRPLVAMAVLAAAIIAAVIIANMQDTSRVTVPQWVGENIDIANKQADDLGLLISEKPEDSDRPAGEILRQDPVSDEQVAKGAVVTLFVSRGPDQVAIPLVIGLKLDDAKERLNTYGFLVEVVGDSRGRNPQVTAQDPGPGTSRPKGSTVRLTISSQEEKGRNKDED